MYDKPDANEASSTETAELDKTTSALDTALEPEPGNASSAASTGHPAAPPSVLDAGRRDGKLTGKQCDDLMDKFIDLVAEGQGIPENQIATLHPILKQAATGDSKYRKAIGACIRDNRQYQYDCAASATSMAAWQKCLK